MNRWMRPVNVLLLALSVIATLSGVLAFGVGAAAPSKIVVAVHGAAGLGLLVLFPAKTRIARRGLARAQRSRTVIGATLVALVLLTVASGVLHAVGGWRTYAGLLPMQIHVGAAVGMTATLGAHVLVHHRIPRRRPLLRRTDLDRRVALRGAVVVVGGAALWLVAPGRARRETGSHEIGSGDPALVPVTQWLFDPVPRSAAVGWALRTPGAALDPDALAALPTRTVRAVLDCTGGWYTEQEWRGVPVSALVPAAGRSIEVVSTTGYRRRFPAHDADALLLATHMGGRPLSAGHGGPMRLVAPGRRGFWWVKWVASIEVVDEPWWSQPPFPVQ